MDEAEQTTEDGLRDAVAKTLAGTPWMPPGVLVKDVVVVYGFVDSNGDHGNGCTYAGASWSALGLLHTALAEWNDEDDD